MPHATRHSIDCTLHTAHCTLPACHMPHATRHSINCTLHTAHCILPARHMSHAAHCTPPVAGPAARHRRVLERRVEQARLAFSLLHGERWAHPAAAAARRGGGLLRAGPLPLYSRAARFSPESALRRSSDHSFPALSRRPLLQQGHRLYLPSTPYYLLPTTYYLLPTTCYLFYLLPATYYVLPITYCLLPTTYSLLPTPHCSWLGIDQ